jgi:hypothetical protein
MRTDFGPAGEKLPNLRLDIAYHRREWCIAKPIREVAKDSNSEQITRTENECALAGGRHSLAAKEGGVPRHIHDGGDSPHRSRANPRRDASNG